VKAVNHFKLKLDPGLASEASRLDCMGGPARPSVATPRAAGRAAAAAFDARALCPTRRHATTCSTSCASACTTACGWRAALPQRSCARSTGTIALCCASRALAEVCPDSQALTRRPPPPSPPPRPAGAPAPPRFAPHCFFKPCKDRADSCPYVSVIRRRVGCTCIAVVVSHAASSATHRMLVPGRCCSAMPRPGLTLRARLAKRTAQG
jgi:hypothetical protein